MSNIKFCLFCGDEIHNESHAGHDEGHRHIEDALISRIADLEAKNERLNSAAFEWISVKDDLPKHGQYVFALAKKSDYWSLYTAKYDEKSGLWADVEHIILLSDIITYWFPMPPLPELTVVEK